jgi:hypothetical protein
MDRAGQFGHALQAGGRVQVPLAPPGKTLSPKIANCPTVAIVCSNGLVLGLIEQAMQPGERVPLCGVANVGVDLQGCADPGVPEDRLRIAGGHAESFRE